MSAPTGILKDEAHLIISAEGLEKLNELLTSASRQAMVVRRAVGLNDDERDEDEQLGLQQILGSLVVNVNDARVLIAEARKAGAR